MTKAGANSAARNGKDYSETVSILKTSRFFTSWQGLDAMHHRAAALAVCRFAREFNGGITDSQSQRLAKAFNLRLTTLALDAMAPTPPVDAFAIEEWCQLTIDETKYVTQLPEGPDEEPAPETDIKAVFEILDTLAKEIKLAEFKRDFSQRKKRGKSVEAANGITDDETDDTVEHPATTAAV